MKKVVPLIVLCLLVLVISAFPVLGAEISGGYYITGDSAIGQDLTFYVPSNFATGSLTYSDGYLFNLTSSSVYLYSPDYPDYTIYAPRFSVFQYRTDVNYGTSYVPLRLTNITDTNVEIFDVSPSASVSQGTVLVAILVTLLVFVGAYVILRR